jgi:hypothetical protein
VTNYEYISAVLRTPNDQRGLLQSKKILECQMFEECSNNTFQNRPDADYRAMTPTTYDLGRLNLFLTPDKSFALARAGNQPSRDGGTRRLTANLHLTCYVLRFKNSLWIGAPVSAVGLNIFQGPFLHHEGCRCLLARPSGW